MLFDGLALLRRGPISRAFCSTVLRSSTESGTSKPEPIGGGQGVSLGVESHRKALLHVDLLLEHYRSPSERQLCTSMLFPGGKYRT